MIFGEFVREKRLMPVSLKDRQSQMLPLKRKLAHIRVDITT